MLVNYITQNLNIFFHLIIYNISEKPVHMGNKLLRPDPLDPFAPFNDDQKSYLKDKFQNLCDQKTKLLSANKISQELKTSLQQATKIINYIDFEGKGEVDFYQFMCAAASLHQDDQQAQQFLFDLFKSGNEMDQNSFQSFFSTVFKYLKFMNLIQQEYSSEIGVKKFKQYDYNHNNSISLDQFRALLQNDFHCSLWMVNLGFSQQKVKQKDEKPQNHEIENDQFVVQQQAGDQASSKPSWKQTAKKMANESQAIKRSNAPNQKLDINYIYGYRSYDTRSNLKYNINSQVVYHTAACGIILNKLKNTQKVNTQHNDDITCLDINVKKSIVATGQMGKKPAIVIWDAISGQTKAIFKGKLQKSIGCIAISPSGKYVAATSMSDNHQIIVYNINQKSLVAFGKGPKSVIYQIKFNSSEDQLICGCAKQVIFAQFSKGKVQCKKGIFGKAPCMPCLSIATLKNNSCVISMQNGLLTLWKGNSCSKIFKEHNKPVGALCERQDGGIISGDSQGRIIVWGQDMTIQKQIDLKKAFGNKKSNNPRVISLFQQYGNILVGTRGGQIIQITKGTAQVLMQGHFDQQLWGLAVSTSKSQFFTGGQDKLLLKWDINKRRCVDKKKLDSAINCLDINRNNLLAVGMKNGIINFFEGNTLKLVDSVYKHKNPDKDMISVVKFSPDGNLVAIAYAPPHSLIYIYNVNDLKSNPKVCQGSPSRINSIDFSRNGQAILTNNTSYEILFFNAKNGVQIRSATQLKGEQWSTMTARFSWASQGIWPPCSDGSDINAVDRSNSKKYLATGDDFSTIKIFDYPAHQEKQINNQYKGHSSHITGVKWSFDDKYLISTGGLQKSIIQWSNTNEQEIKYDYEEPLQNQQKQEMNDQQEYDFDPLEEQKDKKVKKSQKVVQQGEFVLDEDQGDQALCIKPFEGQVKASTPNQYKVSSQKNAPPSQSLNIKHVWGVRNQYLTDRVRNQVKYSANYKTCLFITAALGVQMDLSTKEQTFYQGQSEDLISFSISPDKKFCATGQMAQLNKGAPKSKIVDVHIWDVQKKSKVSVLTKFHQRGIVLVQFSPSGQKILTVGQDDKNSLAVYDWNIQRLAWSSPVCGAKVTGAAWKNQSQYVTCGLKHIKFWSKGKGTMGKVSGSNQWDPMLCAVYWNQRFVTGGTSGTVYLWSGGVGVPAKEHKGRVDCFSIDHNGVLYSGDSMGRILSWKLSSGKLVYEKELFNASKVDSIDPGILSIDFSPDKNILICTNSSSIYQINKQQVKKIMSSHCKGQLWAQSWSPKGTQFVTAGDDKTIRIYNSQTYEEKYLYSNIKEQIRGIDWQKSQGQLIIVGDYKGKIYLFNNKLELLSQMRTKFSKTKPRQQPYWIEDIKFSPNGKYVAFGAHGGASHIEIYQINDNKIQGPSKVISNIFSSALLSIDWSQQSDKLGAISQAYELQFTSLQGKISASSVKDARWATWTGKFGWQVKEIHQDVDYSNINTVCVSPSRTLVATGGDDQKIRLFNFPVNVPKQKNKQFIGHSSHVTKVRFSFDQCQLLSIGGNDRTIILWQVQGRKKQSHKIQQEQQQKNESSQQYDGQEGDDFDQISVPKARQEKVKQQVKQLDDFTLQEQEGDQFMAVKPWKGAIKQPTVAYYKGAGKAPPVDLRLQYAHGYRTKDCRNNLKYTKQGQIAYHTAGLGVIMNSQGHPKVQKFFDGHTDDIISFHQDRNNKQQMYTGQMGAKSAVFLWNTQGQKLKQFKGAKKGVSALCANQKYVVAACLDDNHQVYLWSAKTQKLIKSQKGGKEVIIAMQWVNQNSFVSVGIKHYKLWTVTDQSLKGQSGSFKKNSNILCCVGVKDSKIYVGASDGSLQIWGQKQCTESYKLHSSAIHAIWVGQERILTGSGDKTIKILRRDDLSVIREINCQELLQNSVKPSIRAIDVWQNKILIGTLGSQIYELMSNGTIQSSQQDLKLKLNSKLISGHYAPNSVTNQLWGLCLYDNSSYITCSDDGTVRIWDITKKEQLYRFDLTFNKVNKSGKKTVVSKKQISNEKQKDKNIPDSARGRCLCVSEEKWIVIGCKDGTLKIVNDKFEPTFCGAVNDKKKQISHVKFSPDGRLLAVGDHLGYINVYEWNQGKIKLKHRKIKHNSYIKHFDFSRDSNTIHSTCGGYQLLFWSSQTGKQKTSGATETKDQQWASWNVTLGWPVQGIFQAQMDGTDINAVDRSISDFGMKKMKLLASGDDRGKVRVLEYPCLIPQSQSIKGKGHSSHVTNVKFCKGDELIVSTGGQDQTILQWNCVYKN